jgi:transposase-like protein
VTRYILIAFLIQDVENQSLLWRVVDQDVEAGDVFLQSKRSGLVATIFV